MVFAWFQQRFGSDSVQKSSVRCPFQQSFETSLNIIVKHDFRLRIRILAVVILHQIVLVDANTLVLAFTVIFQKRQIAYNCRETLAANNMIIFFDRTADIGGKHHIDLPGFDRLVSFFLTVITDEFDFQFIFQIQSFDNFLNRFDSRTDRFAVFIHCGKWEIFVEISNAQYFVVRNPVSFLNRQIEAQHGVGKVLLLKSGEKIKVVLKHFVHCGIDIVDQIGSVFVRDQIVCGGTDFFNRREIAFRQHADFQIKIDLSV